MISKMFVWAGVPGVCKMLMLSICRAFRLADRKSIIAGFYPGGDDTICARGNCPGHRLHVVHGSAQSGNDHCSPEEELPSSIPTTVRIDIRDTHVEVFL